MQVQDAAKLLPAQAKGVKVPAYPAPQAVAARAALVQYAAAVFPVVFQTPLLQVYVAVAQDPADTNG